MACRECCRQALHNPKLHNTGVRSLLSIDVLVQVIRANVRAGQVKADPRVGGSKHCSGGPFTLASLLCLMACRECCRQALHNTKLHNTGVRSLLSIDVLVQVIRANVRAGQVKADPRVGAASTAVVGPLP